MTEPTEFSLIPGSPRVAELVRRVPAVAWPFVTLAGLRAAVFLANTNGAWSVVVLLLLASNVAWALLPVALFVGRPDAWRSARGVAAGVLAWSTAAVVYSLFLAATASMRSEWPDPDGLWPLRGLVQAAAVAGPVIVALSLERRRETATTWPVVPVLAALAGTALMCLWQASNAMDLAAYQPLASWGSPDEWGDRAQVLTQAARPLELPALGILAWSGLSAFRAAERPKGFWLLIVVGAVALLVADALGYALAGALQAGLLTPDVYIDWVSRLNELFLAISVAGIVLLLVALARGLPEDTIDLGEVIDQAPDPQPETAGEPA